MIIAVDGPSAAGKGTVARAIANQLGYHFLDTGTLYRMVGFAMLQTHSDLADEDRAANIAASLDPESYADADLRSEKVAGATSRIAVYPAVREKLLSFQRDFAARKPGAVLDGRDIGTVVCPQADIKLYITASAEVRAMRRFEELRAKDASVTRATILADIRARDERDTNRAVAPLLPAHDAVIIDTSDMNREQAIARAMDIVAARRRDV